MSRRRRAVSERGYRLLLRLYPRSMREEFEDEMTEFFRDRLREETSRCGSGARASLRVWLETLRDAVPSAIAARREAAAAAGAAFEPTSRSRSRGRSEGMLGRVLGELWSAVRSLAHRPVLTASIVISLALAIGAHTLVFAVVDTVLLRPLPIPEPERVVAIWNRYGTFEALSSPPDYVDRLDRSERLGPQAAVAETSMNLAGEFEARQVRAARVSSAFFDVFGIEPRGGVAFPDERGAEADPADRDARVVVLGAGLCRSLFDECDDALGRSVRLDGESHLVAGVMPPGFDVPRGTDLFVPLVFTPSQLADDFRGNEYLLHFARLRDGASLEEAEAEMEAIAASVLERVPERRDFLARNAWGANVVPLHEQLVGSVRPTLTLLWGAVLLVLIVTSANVAGLLLASAAAREREIAVRSSLGASRSRLFAQLVAETLVTTLVAAVLGLALAGVLLGVVPRFVPHEIPRIEALALDARAALVQFVLALVLGVAFGATLAWRATSGSLVAGARREHESKRAATLRRALVVQELSIALVLVSGAALLFGSYSRLTNVDPGFEPDGRLTFRLTLPAVSYPDPEERRRFAEAWLERLRALPGVRHAAASDRVPLDGRSWTGTFYPEGFTPAPGEPTPGADRNIVSSDYFETLGIPVLAGRPFDGRDRPDSPRVVIVDSWTAERFWPEGAVGRRINLNDPDGTPDFRLVVGVVGHVRYERLDEPGRPQLYFPLGQSSLRSAGYTVAANLDPQTLVESVRREQRAFAPDVPVAGARSLGTLVSSSLAAREFGAVLLGGFAIAAFALAGVGVFGLLSYSVSRRRRELGVRMALGASGGSILRLVLKEALSLAALGIALGALVAIGLSRFVASLLFGIEPNDAGTLAASALALSLLALASALVPARRAARLDPVRVLRLD